MKNNRNFAITIVCVILGLIIAWQFKSISYNNNAAGFESKREEDVKDLLLIEQRKNADLGSRNIELQNQIKGIENTQGNSDKTRVTLQKELERVNMVAGLTAVKGKGVEVTVDNGELFNVEDVDILNLLNELRASDAQAISLNDERMVAMSEVRVAGGYIMVNGKQIGRPYIIKAIADPDRLEASLKLIGGVVENLQLYLKVSVEKKLDITIPALKDDGSVIKTDLLTPVN